MRLNRADSDLRSVVLDWKGILSNPNFLVQGQVVSWRGDQGGMHPQVLRVLDVAEMRKTFQYSWLVSEDGAVVQVRAVFPRAGDIPVRATLGYYGGRPVFESGHVFEEMKKIAGSSGTLPLEEDDRPVAWIRLDWNPGDARGVLHSSAHLQCSLGSSCRLPMRGFPTPKQFMELVIAWFYPELWRRRRLRSDGQIASLKGLKRVSVPWYGVASEAELPHVAHLAIPQGPPSDRLV